MCAVPTTFLQAGAIWLRKGKRKSMSRGKQVGGRKTTSKPQESFSQYTIQTASTFSLGKGIPRRQLHGSKQARHGVRLRSVGEGGAPVGMTCRLAVAATSPCSRSRKARTLGKLLLLPVWMSFHLLSTFLAAQGKYFLLYCCLIGHLSSCFSPL